MDPFDDFVLSVGPIAARLRRAGNNVDADALCDMTARILRTGEERDGKNLSGGMHRKFNARLVEHGRPDEATFRQWMKEAGYSPRTIHRNWRRFSSASTKETGS